MDGHEHLDLRALPGSERAPAPGVKKAGSPLPGDAPVEATLVLRRRAELNDATLGAILSRDELAVAGGAATGTAPGASASPRSSTAWSPPCSASTIGRRPGHTSAPPPPRRAPPATPRCSSAPSTASRAAPTAAAKP